MSELSIAESIRQDYEEEIERLKKSEKEALDTLESATYENINLINKVDRLNNILNEVRELCLMFASGRLERTNYDDILEIIDKVGVDKE